MKLSVTKAVEKILTVHFEKLLLSGEFPEVKFSNTGGFRSYSLMPYCEAWGRFTKLVDREIKHDMVDDLGIFSRKHSGKFFEYVDKVTAEITAAQVKNAVEHFRTFGDSLMDYMGTQF